jgi:hypothetical protein
MKPSADKTLAINHSKPQKAAKSHSIKNDDEQSQAAYLQSVQVFQQALWVQTQDQQQQADNEHHIQTQRTDHKILQTEALEQQQQLQHFCHALQSAHQKAQFEVSMPPFGHFKVRTHASAQQFNFILREVSPYTQQFMAQHKQHLCHQLSQHMQKNVDIVLEDDDA